MEYVCVQVYVSYYYYYFNKYFMVILKMTLNLSSFEQCLIFVALMYIQLIPIL